jgi:hypothetical protein
MLLFSTVLFVDGNPVGYKVYREEENRIILNPAENPNRAIVPPVISVRHNEGDWQVEGTNNRDLIDQVIEDVSLNGTLPTHSLSAAP